ncbi:uncharacterized protein [Misgurnus anguillicaudatus]|uniref:uncharacterized protein n=1 Tax=Misgurnus anguillicaudatus TaxID=75329 RepID=UPI003CCFA62A
MNPSVSVEDYGGFQTQFTSIMETILQTAVREATKLFQLSLQHLKAELVQLRQENGKLTTAQLSMGVKSRITAVGNKKSYNISKFRDVGVQCEKPVLVDQGCSPHECLGHVGDITSDKLASLCASEDGRRQLALLLIKQEPQEPECNKYAPGYFLLKQEGAEPILVRREPNKETVERVVIPPGFQTITRQHGNSRGKSPPTVTSLCNPRGNFYAQNSNQPVNPTRHTGERTLENNKVSYSQNQTKSAIAPAQALITPIQHTPVSTVNLSAPVTKLSGAPDCTSIPQVKPTTVYRQPEQKSEMLNQVAYQKDPVSNVCRSLHNTSHRTQPAQLPVRQSQVFVSEARSSKQLNGKHTEKTFSRASLNKSEFSPLTQQPVFSPQTGQQVAPLVHAPMPSSQLPVSVTPDEPLQVQDQIRVSPQGQMLASSPQISPQFQFPLVQQPNRAQAAPPSFLFTSPHLQGSVPTLSSADTLNPMQSQYSAQPDQFSSSLDQFLPSPDNTPGLLDSLDTLQLHSPILLETDDATQQSSMYHSHPPGKFAPLLTMKEQQAAASTNSNVVLRRDHAVPSETCLEAADVQFSPCRSASFSTVENKTEKSDIDHFNDDENYKSTLQIHLRTQTSLQSQPMNRSDEVSYKDMRMDGVQNDTISKATLSISNKSLPNSNKTLHRTTTCSECGRVLSNASALENHMRLHTGERPFTCSQCGKAFPSVRGLNRHVKVHAEEKRYQCEQCGKSFVYHFTLTKHQLIHSGERPFPCKVCGKRFLAKADRSTHMRMHTGEKPFACTQCGKKFKHRVALNMHLQGHRGEKRYVCPHCEKGFVDLGNFKRHKLIHTGERPFECKECGKRFTQSAHLKKHVNSQHMLHEAK